MSARVEARRVDGCLSSREVCSYADISHRTLLYWRDRGYVAPTFGGNGTGDPAWWGPYAIERVVAIAERVAWGMTPEAAARHEDPPLPAPPRANNSWPHLTADPVRKRIVQHLPFERSP
jgi:hypothetical protein